MTKTMVLPKLRQWPTSSSRRLNCFWKLAIILAAKLKDWSMNISGTDWAMSDKTTCGTARSGETIFFHDARTPL